MSQEIMISRSFGSFFLSARQRRPTVRWSFGRSVVASFRKLALKLPLLTRWAANKREAHGSTAAAYHSELARTVKRTLVETRFQREMLAEYVTMVVCVVNCCCVKRT